MTSVQAAGGDSSPALFSGKLGWTLLRLGGLALIDAFALWLIYQFFADGETPLAVALIVATLFINAVFLVERLYPFGWLSPGIFLIILMVLYPTVITVYYAFTNYSTGNLLTPPVAVQQILANPSYRYVQEGAEFFDSTVYRNEAGEYLLWLEGRDTGEIIIARQNLPEAPATAEERGIDGVTFADEPPPQIEGFTLLSGADAAAALAEVTELTYGEPVGTLALTPYTEDMAAEGFVFDVEQGLVVDFTGRRPAEYEAFVYQNEVGEVALWLLDGRDWILLRPGKPVIIEGLPQTIGDFRILSNRERTEAATVLPTLSFGTPDDPITVDPRSANRAGRFASRFTYDAEQAVLIDSATGAVYRPVEGTFTLDTESVEAAVIAEQALPTTLAPGYFVVIGLENFNRLLTDTRLRGPFVEVFIWTLVHAAATVLVTFTMGLAMALLFNDASLPMRKVLRSVVLIPYAIPAFISVVVWRGMFDPNLGVINGVLSSVGIAPNWYSDATAARLAILFVQMWLGFPYIMLVVTGALQAISRDIYEAAEVDGANSWQKFRFLTLPLLLVAVGPLLIASFAFNFNNFTVIELFNSGGPAIPNSSVPAGYTDILITYTYAQAFGTAGGTDYGFAAAISLFIFVMVAVITIFNFRFTRTWEEVSANV
jgi:ABC-type sugar transport system permease subunit